MSQPLNRQAESDRAPASLPGQSPARADDRSSEPQRDLPSLSLPKAGGAIRGMGEKFTANPVTGTAGVTIPVALTPARGELTPQLNLTYDSGAGNGPFGLGWSLDVPSICRKTDKGLPKYCDDTDVFQLSGAEDLVPAVFPAQRGDGVFDVVAYRPRTEGLYSRIERWRDRTSGDTHWRVTSKTNVTSVFGRTAATRIADPDDPAKVFRWLLEDVADDHGNLVRYEYKAEDWVGVDRAAPYERNRMAVTNRYLERVRYGNSTPGQRDFCFELILDHGDHEAPTTVADTAWTVRADPFSTRRSGFEIRTYRLCHRIMLFHTIAELDAAPVLVSSTDLEYLPDPAATKLIGARQHGYLKSGSGYTRKSLPPLTFEYTERLLSTEIRSLTTEAGAPQAQLERGYGWVDLDGEGLAGILVEQDGTWYYRANRGGGAVAAPRVIDPSPVGATLSGRRQLLDLAGDGAQHLADFRGLAPGFYRRTPDRNWSDFTTFRSLPMISWTDPNLRFVDLSGDGLADVLLTGSDGFTWYPSEGIDGFGEPAQTFPACTEEHGPRLVFADAEQSVYLADMTGDGLTDLVRIRTGEIAYWPNLGYGRFGAKVPMSNAPFFDHPERFDQRRIRLADIDGSAPADLIYLGPERITVWFNEAGNSWSAGAEVSDFIAPDRTATVTVTDLLGTGTACLVVAESRPDGEPQIRYLDLMATGKPHLLSAVDNHRGRRTAIDYASSTVYYLADQAANQPWVTPLPFPVQVVAAVRTHDAVTDTTLVTTYRYRHGHYDGVEREFRGFGYVEQRDALSFNGSADRMDQPPAVVKRWQHTGRYGERARVSTLFADEYHRYDGALDLTDTVLPYGLTAEEEREAVRALRGHVLREEIYAENRHGELGNPYSVTETNYRLRLIQPRGSGQYSVVAVDPGETLTIYTEQRDDDPRLAHTVTLAVDEWGEVRRTAQISYPRRGASLPDEQARLHVMVSERDVVHDVNANDRWRVGISVESRDYEFGGLSPHGSIFAEQELRDRLTDAERGKIPYQERISDQTPQRRLLARTQQTYASADLDTELPLGQVAVPTLPWRTYRQVFDEGQVGTLYGTRVTDAVLAEAGYTLRQGIWWAPSGRQIFDGAHFYQPTSYVDPFGAQWRIEYERHSLRQVRLTDPVQNVVEAALNYRVMQPWLLTDANRNRTAVRFDPLGLITATAVLGKNGRAEGDFLDLSTPEASNSDAPTTWLEYDLAVQPVRFHTFAREEHGTASRIRESWTYFDGMGRTMLTKAQAEPGRDGRPRWVGTGRTIYDNKGNPIKKYEPYFAPDGGFDTEPELVRHGVTEIFTYDPLGRLIRTDYPDGSLSRVEFDCWERRDWDRNDTLRESRWYAERIELPADDPRHLAATATEPHAGTYGVTVFDTMGRTHRTIADNRPEKMTTTVVLDIQGNELTVLDPREILVAERYFDMLGRPAYTRGADTGERWSLVDATGEPVRGWDSRDIGTRWRYDDLRRPTHAFAAAPGAAERLRLRYYYGEALTDGAEHNLRTKPYLMFDGAGLTSTIDIDFKGNTVLAERTLAADVTTEPDWSVLSEITEPTSALAQAATLLESETYRTAATFDALSRPTLTVGPDGSHTKPTYNEASLLERVETRLRGVPEWTVFIANIDYNARGQRELIELGCGTRTEYAYEKDTFRLAAVDTGAADSSALQSMRYTYDPVGNVVIAADPAEPTVFFANTAVGSTRTHRYDPIYRLVEATGREHIGQTTQPGPGEPPTGPIPHANDSAALRAYRENYRYDNSGNIVEVTHTAAADGSWTRRHQVAADSNRLLANSIPGDAADRYSAIYRYDTNGNTISMPHLDALGWDADNRLIHADLGGGGDAYYQYDSGGRRIRATVRNNGTSETRIYLGNNELYLRAGAGTTRTRRETLHVVDGTRRIAIVETTVVENGRPVPAPEPVQRYQLGDHLGSATMELSDTGAVLSYEEYHPFGTTSYRSATGAAQISLKRYRFTGKERDSETGLYYHGARYYAVWLGRWNSCDPAGFGDGTNLYAYVRNNPVRLLDPSGKASDDMPDYPPMRPVGPGSGEKKSEPAAPGPKSGPAPRPAPPSKPETPAKPDSAPAPTAKEEAIARSRREKDAADKEEQRIQDLVNKEKIPELTATAVDPRGLDHIIAVVDTINWALERSKNLKREYREPLKEVLAGARAAVTNLRDAKGTDNSRSLILRDAERYLWARAGMSETIPGIGNLPSLNRTLATAVSGGYEVVKKLSIATGWGLRKVQSTDNPFSNPGGDPWFTLGLQHYDKFDKDSADRVVDPKSPTYEDQIRKQDLAAEIRDILQLSGRAPQ